MQNYPVGKELTILHLTSEQTECNMRPKRLLQLHGVFVHVILKASGLSIPILFL